MPGSFDMCALEKGVSRSWSRNTSLSENFRAATSVEQISEGRQGCHLYM